MFVYSPLLSGVALSTFPLYVLLVFGVAPIYKSLIRRRAVANARTQSHLIEVIGGIQTVKAQHFELTARWKWQDRYRSFVNEGFKSVALGATSGEIGNFLNQLSGLLVLWVGMWLVLQGNSHLDSLSPSNYFWKRHGTTSSTCRPIPRISRRTTINGASK